MRFYYTLDVELNNFVDRGAMVLVVDCYLFSW